MTTRGMVSVEGKTYRITRLMPRLYEAVRVLDDALIGQFFCGPKLELVPVAAQSSTLRLVAREAVRQAKTSWAGRLARID